MLKDLVVKEIKSLNFSDSCNKVGRIIGEIKDVCIEDNEEFIATLSGYTDEKRNQLASAYLFKIDGCVLLEDTYTGKIYEGEFKAPYVLIEHFGFGKIKLRLLKLDDRPKYIITVPKTEDEYIEEIQDKTLEENVENSVQSIINGIFEGLKIAKDTGKIKRITVSYDDNMENVITSIYQAINLKIEPTSILINESDLIQ